GMKMSSSTVWHYFTKTEKNGKTMQLINQQQYLAHGIQLAIKASLYSSTSGDSVDDESSEEEDYELGHLAFGDIFSNSVPSFKHLQVDEVINKVRATVKLFRKSPKKNDALQKIIEARFNKNLELIRDCPTRWNSFAKM